MWVGFLCEFCLRIRNHGSKPSGYNRDLLNDVCDAMGIQRGDSRGQFKSWFRLARRVPDADKNWDANKKILVHTKHSQTKWGRRSNQYHFQNIWRSQDSSQSPRLELVYEQRLGRSIYRDENNIEWLEAGIINLVIAIEIFHWLTSWTIRLSIDPIVWTSKSLRCISHINFRSFRETIVIASSFHAGTSRRQ